MGVVRLGGARLYYQTAGPTAGPASGEAPALVLIHGLGSSGADWEDQVPVFSKYFRVIVPDLRGHGASARRGAYSVEQFAADTWQLLDRLSVEAPALLGHSMGGAVAMQMTLDRPGRVTKLVLANTLPNFRPQTLAQRWMLWSRLLLMGWLGPRGLAEVMTEKMYPRPDQAALRRKVAKRGARNDRNAYLGSIRALTGWSVADRLAELKLPVLVLAAELDFLPRAETDRFVAALPDARLVLFPGTGHGLPLEEPAAFNRAVLEFLGSGDSDPFL